MKDYLSMGFGVNSVALYLLMEKLNMEFEAVFVDHGGDWPETYEYADYFIATGRPVTILQPQYHRKRTTRPTTIFINTVGIMKWSLRRWPVGALACLRLCR